MRKFAKQGAALLLLGVLLYLAGPQELLSALGALTWPVIAGLLGLSAALILVSARKWQLFLGALDEGRAEPAATLGKLFQLYLVGYFVNLLLPSFVGGDAVRSYYAGKQHGQHSAAAATILERFTGVVAMVSLALFCMWSSSLVTWQVQLIVVLVALGVLAVAFLGLCEVPAFVRKVSPRTYSVWGHLEQIQRAFRIVGRNKPVLVRAMALSFLFHCLTVLNTLLAAHGVGWADVPVAELFVVLPIILLIGAIPISPSGLGIQEGAFFYFLQGLGATPGQALAVAVVLRAKSYVLAIIGGVLFWKIKGAGGEVLQTEER